MKISKKLLEILSSNKEAQLKSLKKIIDADNSITDYRLVVAALIPFTKEKRFKVRAKGLISDAEKKINKGGK